VIADAVLLFGYGEDRRTIDGALVEDVIEELETTGVLTAPQARQQDDVESREARTALREQRIAEQHRIVTEQYRLLRMRELQLAAATRTAREPVRRADPPMAAAAPATPESRSPGLWSRLRQGILSAGQSASPSARTHSTAGYLDEDLRS